MGADRDQQRGDVTLHPSHPSHEIQAPGLMLPITFCSQAILMPALAEVLQVLSDA